MGFEPMPLIISLGGRALILQHTGDKNWSGWRNPNPRSPVSRTGAFAAKLHHVARMTRIELADTRSTAGSLLQLGPCANWWDCAGSNRIRSLKRRLLYP